jgi:hypothetical protein
MPLGPACLKGCHANLPIQKWIVADRTTNRHHPIAISASTIRDLEIAAFEAAVIFSAEVTRQQLQN